MPRITNKMITDRWIEAFEKGTPFTPPEKRMMGIKLAQLKKSIKKHIEETGRQTDLSVEQIIMDGIEFGVMTNQPWRSIASLGYKTLDPSMDYWVKRRKLEADQQQRKEAEAKQSIQQPENYNQNNQKTVEKVITSSYNKSTNKTNNSPAWMNNTEW